MCSQRWCEGVVFPKSDGSEQPRAKNMPDQKQELLRALPAITELLKSETAAGWLRQHPQPLVTECLRRALAALRQQILNGDSGPAGVPPVTAAAVLAQAEKFSSAPPSRICAKPSTPPASSCTPAWAAPFCRRAWWIPMLGALKGYCTLAVDRDSGERAERDELVEYILTELTGAEAATVVNNNAAATLLALAALAAPREVIVSRGQLIEIGGSFRLPEVMAQSGARLVEVGATNRTHPKDYQKAVTENTAAILRVHPSNYRVVGFTSEVPLRELAELARARNLILMDDLGAGALVDLKPFGLPHEPTVRESIEAGADVVLFSGDKLIGAGQCGVIVGRKDVD